MTTGAEAVLGEGPAVNHVNGQNGLPLRAPSDPDVGSAASPSGQNGKPPVRPLSGQKDEPLKANGDPGGGLMAPPGGQTGQTLRAPGDQDKGPVTDPDGVMPLSAPSDSEGGAVTNHAEGEKDLELSPNGGSRVAPPGGGGGMVAAPGGGGGRMAPPSGSRGRVAPPDGGWGWMCVLGAALSQVLYGALIRAFGVTYLALLARYEESATVTAWVGALNFSCTGFLGPLVAALCRRYTCRWVTVAGGLLTFTGLLSTGFAPNIFVTYVTFGLVTGVGQGCAYPSGLIIIGQYFDKRKAIAMGLASFSSGLGALICPPLLLWLFNHYGFTGTFLLLAAASLHICIAGGLFRPLQRPARGVKAGGQGEAMLPETRGTHEGKPTVLKREDSVHPVKTDKEVKNFGGDQTEELLSSSDTKTEIEIIEEIHEEKLTLKERYMILCKSPCAMALIFQTFTLGYSLSLLSGFLPALAVENGVDEASAAFLLSISGISSIVTTLTLSALLDIPLVRRYRLHVCNVWQLVVGVTTLLIGVVDQYLAYALLMAACAATAGPLMSQRATLISDLVGRSSEQEGIGLLLMATAAGSLLGRCLAGTIRDTWGRYNEAFILAGALCLLAMVIFQLTLIRRGVLARRRKANKLQTPPTQSI